MINKWNKTLLAVLIGAALFVEGGFGFGVTALAAGGEQPQTADTAAAAGQASYSLTPLIQAAVQSASVEAAPSGRRIAVTVRMYNSGTERLRVPDFELRAQTADGLEYKLDASSGNKKALKPQEIAEMVFMSVVDSTSPLELAGLSFVHVDEYVYPKQETQLVSLPLGSDVWYGGAGSTDRLPTRVWGQTFAIPGLNSRLVYTPAGFSRQTTEKGPAVVVTVLAENKGTGREAVPDFRIDAASDQKKYAGVRTEQGNVQLEAGEKAYIHYAVQLEANAQVDRLIVMTTETFAADGQTTAIDTGKIVIAVPDGGLAEPTLDTGYSIGTPIRIDPLSKAIDHTEISLVELHIQQNPGDSYKTGFAKFRLTNTSDKSVPTPSFEAELVSAGGAAYSGMRQTSVPDTLNPGLGSVISYAYHIPLSESSGGFVLKLLDGKTASPYNLTIAALQVPVQQEVDNGTTLHLYPFDMTLEDWSVGTNYVATNTTYSYKMKVTLDLKQADNVVVDSNFSKLHFEVVDKLGRVLGTGDSAFTGTQKLVSGSQTLATSNIQSEQIEFPVILNLYEQFDTASGAAKRFLKTLQ
ncbi:hypothetical protein [Paenibacillus thalictri]|uniref:DUF4352 domain-containing protein n=1 Tax=Paenibacillus thalictri TaxID=2527873 RepID=A0A4Q9DP37_9BACL|nr:hypothetical protein [Paenibacillus thalictri]TBL77874.1 hypothetical protein EYB31_17220 [Paenibacillus thalictri]